ncbi:MFS transporter [Rhodopila sp.]|uniref:MFS transporter n=1 Tax=Rhodopila sp. TaxID=2480087 RepID=UPI003D0EA7D8
MAEPGALEAATLRRVSLRLLPFLMLAYLICYIDRTNAGFAALQMNKDIGLSGTVFGLGGGIFFVGYFLFEVPSNLALEKYGARTWICRIMISWGLVSAGMAAVAGPASFVIVRFILGAAEAGFFPGVILYLTYWFPAAQRARIVGIFMVAIPVAGFIGSPISATLLGFDGLLGLRGWQWVFILEAVPAILLGFVCLIWLTDRPEHANWLTAEQRAWLTERLDSERRQARRVAQGSAWRVVRNPTVLALAIVYAGGATASSGLALWQPQFIKSFGLSNSQVGWLNALPYVFSAAAMIWWGQRSDRKNERLWHTAIPLGLSGVALALCVPFTGLMPTIGLLCVCVVCTSITRGPFWALTSDYLAAPSAAAGIAMVNAMGTGCGFICNTLMGWIFDATHSYPLAMLPIVAFALLGTAMLLMLGKPEQVVVAGEAVP